MNAKILFLATSCSAVLMAVTTALFQSATAQPSIQQMCTQKTSSQTNLSQTVIGLGASMIQQPYVLRVSVPQGTQLTGQITLGDKVIKRFDDNQASINLSPILSEGSQTIKICGTYTPHQSSVKVEFSGPGTDLSQEMGGGGKLDQTLVINVE